MQLVLRLILGLLVLVVVLAGDLSTLRLVLLLLLLLLIILTHGSLVSRVLRSHGNLRAKDINMAVSSSNSNQILALSAAMLAVFEPARQAGKAGQADAEKTEDGSNKNLHRGALSPDDGHGSLTAKRTIDPRGLVRKLVKGQNGRCKRLVGIVVALRRPIQLGSPGLFIARRKRLLSRGRLLRSRLMPDLLGVLVLVRGGLEGVVGLRGRRVLRRGSHGRGGRGGGGFG